MKRIFVLALVSALSVAAVSQVHHTFPALDTNNVFTGTDQFQAGVVLGPVTVAGLASPPFSTSADNTLVRVTDGTPGTSPCTGGGSGAFAVRVSGVWSCFGIGGIGTLNTLAKWTSSSAVGNSLATDDGTTLTYTGTGGAVIQGTGAGFVGLGQGTAQAIGTNIVGVTAPTSVTGYNLVFPGAAGNGILVWSNVANIVTGVFTAVQGTDTHILSSGTVIGLAANLCTDANGGATTVGCSGGGVTGSGTTSKLPKWTSSTALGDSAVQQSVRASQAEIDINGPYLNIDQGAANVSYISCGLVTPSACSSGMIIGPQLQNVGGSQLRMNPVGGGGGIQFNANNTRGSMGIIDGGATFQAPIVQFSNQSSATFAHLPSPVSGYQVFCFDCKEDTDPCTAGGGGTFAFGVDVGSPKWVCLGKSLGTVSSVTIAGTSNQITASGTCTITTTGTCTLSLPAAIIIGTDNSLAGTLQMSNGSANAHTIWGSAATTSNTILGFAAAPVTGHLVGTSVSGTTTTLTDGGAPYSLPTQYTKLRCETGLGDGLNAITAGTYVMLSCVNDSGVTWTVTGIHCFTDNAGTSTLDVKNNAGTSFLTGVVTCNSTKTSGGAAGSQSGTTTLANTDALNFTFVADGTSKTTSWTISMTQ